MNHFPAMDEELARWAVTTDREVQRRLLSHWPCDFEVLQREVEALGLRPDPAEGHQDGIFVYGPIFGGDRIVMWRPGPHATKNYDQAVEAAPEILAHLLKKADELDTKELTKYVTDIGLKPPSEPPGYTGWSVCVTYREGGAGSFSEELHWIGPHEDHGEEDDLRVTDDVAVNTLLITEYETCANVDEFIDSLKARQLEPPHVDDVRWILTVTINPWNDERWLEWQPISLSWPPFDINHSK